MRIGITYDLKPDSPLSNGLPDDHHEEFDSPATIEAIAEVFRARGHEVVKLGDGRDFLQSILADPVDIVFNTAEGEGIGRAREARVPAVLEMLGIPHTGSDPLTLAVTLDKDCARRLVASAGGIVPPGFVVYPDDDPDELPARHPLPFPVIAKPAWEGSSKGVRAKSLVERPEDLADAIAWLRRDHRQPVLVEEYIRGEELTVGIFGNANPEILGILRVVPLKAEPTFIYGLEVKRDYLNRVRYECPPALPAEVLRSVEGASRTAFRALGCRDVARVDFRLRDGVPYFLEVNPLPGLNPESSDLIIMARLCGWTHARVIERILDAALERIHVAQRPGGLRSIVQGR
jgi:D-alanine-D-alanine ligase